MNIILNKIEKGKQRLAVLCLVCSLLVGCSIHDDYSECMSDVEIRVTFKNNTPVNWLEGEITRLDFFVFDENGKFYSRATDSEGPFTNDYSKKLLLPYNTFKIVVWGNLYEDKQIDEVLEKGVTDINDLKIKLVTAQTRATTSPLPNPAYPKLENFVQPTPATLFWGETAYIQPSISYNEAVTIDLKKNTHDVHVTLRWKNQEGFYDFSTEHQRTTRAYIVGSNGDVKFDNSLPRERNVTYVPLYRDPANMDPFLGQTGQHTAPPQLAIEGIAAVMPVFRSMRLMAEGSTEMLVITTLQEDGTEKVVYARSIVELIRLTGHFNTQTLIDERNDFHIVVDFRCTDPTHQFGSSWLAVSITVNGWVVVQIDAEL